MKTATACWNILIPDRLQPPAEIEAAVFGDRARLIVPVATHVDEIDAETWAAADAVLAWHELQYTAKVIARLERCQVLVRVGVGFDNVDLTAASAAGIPVCNVPDYGTGDVADHALALLLSLARGIGAASEQLRRSNEHWHWLVAGRQRRLAGSTLGIIGLGRIGTAVALRARAFGLRVIFHDPYVPDGQDKALGLTRCDDLTELLAQCDAVTFHTPLTGETRGLADASFFAALKPGAILINTARGPIVELDALHEALRSGRLRAAGLDVLETEPPDRAHPLLAAWSAGEEWIAHRLALTPHFAFWCDEAYHDLRAKAAATALTVLEGGPPRNQVNDLDSPDHSSD